MTQSVTELGLPTPKERRRLREAAELTHEEVAAAVGVTATTVRSWETGRTDPRGRKREAYAKLLARLVADADTKSRTGTDTTDAPAGEATGEGGAAGANGRAEAGTPVVEPRAATAGADSGACSDSDSDSAVDVPAPAAAAAATAAADGVSDGPGAPTGAAAADPDAASALHAADGGFGPRGPGTARPLGARTRPKAGIERAAKPDGEVPRHEARATVKTATGGAGGLSTLRPGAPVPPNNTGAGTGGGPGAGAGADSGPSTGTDTGPGAGTGTDPVGGTTGHSGTDTDTPVASTGTGTGTGTGNGTDLVEGTTGRSGTDTDPPVASTDTGPVGGTASHSGTNTDTPVATTDTGPVEGTTGHSGTDTDPPVASTDTGPDTDTSPSAGTDTSTGPSTGTGTGTDTDPGAGTTGCSGTNTDPPVASTDAGPGHGTDPGTGASGPATGSGTGTGEDTAASDPGPGDASPIPGTEAGTVPQGPRSDAAVSAFDALYNRTAPALTRQAYLLTGRRALAQEAVERAFQQAWGRWPAVATDPDPVGWVRAATYEYALSPWHQFRRAHKHPDKPPADTGDRIVMDAMLALPPAHRRTVLLYDGVGLDLPDTAAETEASTPTAGGRLVNAHAELADRIPALAAAAPEKQSALLRERLGTLTPAVRLEPRAAAVVRAAGEGRARRWTRAALGLTTMIAVAATYTAATAPTEYEPPLAPGVSVSGVPPHSGPQQLSDEGRQLHEKLLSDPAAGPARVSPKAE